MRRHWLGILGAALVVGALVLAGVGVAQAWGTNGGFGPWAASQSASGQQGPYGPGYMMGPNATYGPGGMMGAGWHHGMMGNDGDEQNAADATPVTGNAVTIENFAYQPANLQVKAGTTVTWTNNDTAPHTVTFRDSSLKSSGILRQGDTYSYTFTKTGTFTYYCDVHPYMTAQVVVTN